MDPQLRPADLADLPLLTALARHTFAEAYSTDMTEAALKEHLDTQLSPERMGEMFAQDAFLLAGAGGALVGFVQLGAARPEYRGRGGELIAGPDDGEVRRLYVLAGAQGRGLGGRLMTAALRHPRLVGRRVFLTVWHTNLGAQRFYARHGFREVGTVPFPAPSTGFDLLLLRQP